MSENSSKNQYCYWIQIYFILDDKIRRKTISIGTYIRMYVYIGYVKLYKPGKYT